MAVEAITGKKCTLKIGTTQYEGWITNFTTTGDKASETVPTWGEDVAYVGTPSYTATASFLFDPNDSAFGPAMETAFQAETPVTLEVAYGTATRTLTNWLVSSYSDDAPADGLVTCECGMTGPGMWATVYATA